MTLPETVSRVHLRLLAAATASMPARAAAGAIPQFLAGHAITADATVMPPADAPADTKESPAVHRPQSPRRHDPGAEADRPPRGASPLLHRLRPADRGPVSSPRRHCIRSLGPTAIPRCGA